MYFTDKYNKKINSTKIKNNFQTSYANKWLSKIDTYIFCASLSIGKEATSLTNLNILYYIRIPFPQFKTLN